MRILKSRMDQCVSTDESVWKRNERAAFVLGRPATNWADLDCNWSSKEITDMIKMFLTDGGTLYYTALLITDRNSPQYKPVSQLSSSTHLSHASREYNVNQDDYYRYVAERTFERVFLIMNSMDLDRYKYYGEHADVPVDPADLGPIETGGTIMSHRLKAENNPTAGASTGTTFETNKRYDDIKAPKSTPLTGKRGREPEYADAPLPEEMASIKPDAPKKGAGGGLSGLLYGSRTNNKSNN